ncbi:hypothetical protein PBY51_001762 [Eleginops maclovinus]|uniref:Uncharacterized protein n=1 Tax=Eleginops maclovinus TaxID=56733 RepID=A0AAN7WY12_ELEMC|nr:hypothetical protein PBY51_001762 [Eleginops maclovinus]
MEGWCRKAEEIWGEIGEGGLWGATDGTPRCEGRRLPRVGGGGVGADKWGVGGGTFPQSASRDDEEGHWLHECV